MLKEKIVYKDELPINVITANIKEYPIHFHDDMEVVFVLSGSVILKAGYYTYTLRQGNIFIVNDRDMHSFESTGEDNMVMMLQLDLTYFSRYYDSLKNNFFVTDMEDDNDESLEVLRNILGKIMMEVLQKGYGYQEKVIESTHNLISCLISDFQYFVMEDGKFKNESKNKGNKILAGRLNRITDYMYDNFSRKLTLSEIAEREHLSIYYLSHIIKEATGLSFQDLLSYIRVEESEKLLLGTNKKIGAIAEETGFSAVRYYIKHFENWFGMHPVEYRKKFIGKTISREIQAKYDRCSPGAIEDAIRKQVKGVYADYVDKLKAKPVIININSQDIPEIKEKPELAATLERPVNSGLAEPYDKLADLDEHVIAAGENYIVSAGDGYPSTLDHLSILLYNFDENVSRSMKRIQTENELLRILRNYDEEIEFLARCNGMLGEFRITKYRLEKDNYMKKINDSLNPSGAKSRREAFIDKLSEAPNVTMANYTSSDVLSVRTTFKGIGSELILIDRLKDK